MRDAEWKVTNENWEEMRYSKREIANEKQGMKKEKWKRGEMRIGKKWEIKNEKCEMRKAEWGKRNEKRGMRNEEWKRRNWKWKMWNEKW